MAALRTLSVFDLTQPQAGFGHDKTVRAQAFNPGSLVFACSDGDFTIVEQNRFQDRFCHSEMLIEDPVQARQVQTSLVVAQGLGDEFGDGWSHCQTWK